MMVRLALLLLAALPVFGAFANGYSYRRALTIDQTKLTGDVSNFPVLVSGTYSYLATVANGGLVTDAQGDDVVFTSSDGTTALKHEVEIYTAASGLVVYWVKVPSVSSSAATVIYIYYGNAAVTTDQSDKVNVWDANYKAVYHLPNGSSLTANDSTSGAFNGTLVNTPTAAVGQIDGAANFAVASSEYVTNANPIITTYPFTFSAWVKMTDAIGTDSLDRVVIAVVNKGSSGDQHWMAIYRDDGRGGGGVFVRLVTQAGGVAYERYAAYGTGTSWHHVAITATDDTISTIYIDGVSQSVSTSGTPGSPSSLSDSYVGAFLYNTSTVYSPMNGEIDEPRISNSVRSAHWMKAEFNSTNSPSTFYAVGSQETSGRRRIAILN